jgi:hypothetical protein
VGLWGHAGFIKVNIDQGHVHKQCTQNRCLGNMKQLDQAIPARHHLHMITAKHDLLASYTMNILSTQINPCLIY